jgi:hypothetical protein
LATISVGLRNVSDQFLATFGTGGRTPTYPQGQRRLSARGVKPEGMQGSRVIWSGGMYLVMKGLNIIKWLKTLSIFAIRREVLDQILINEEL